MDVEVVTIGDELLLGFTVDTNAAHLAAALADAGVAITRRTTCGDSAPAIARAVGDALDRTGAVITTGGLGPTSDDLTKPSIAALFGLTLHLDEEQLARMRRRWHARWPDRPMPESNRQQAMIPSGAEILRNDRGSAPGIWLEDERGRWVAMLPGVPGEMRAMLADALLPRLLRRLPTPRTVVRSRTLRTTGVAESQLAEQIAGLPTGVGDGVGLAYLPGADGVDLRLDVRGVGADDADARLAAAAERVRGVVGEALYGEGDADLAGVVLECCRARSLTLAVAESCTGGLLGARLTAIPGSSDVVRGGVIAYANDVKRDLLHVEGEVMAREGAVSEAVVRAMVTGVRAALHASAALAITGIAGPGGGSAEKPVGTVWIALDLEGSLSSRLLRLAGDRDEIRYRAVQAALDLLRRRVGEDVA